MKTSNGRNGRNEHIRIQIELVRSDPNLIINDIFQRRYSVEKQINKT